MTMSDEVSSELTLASKINRLFDLCRSREDPEQSVAAVAMAVSRILHRTVPPQKIADMRVEGSDSFDQSIVEALASHFGVPRDYLATDGTYTRNVDRQLQLLIAARDAGVKRLALRGSEPHQYQADNIFELLQKIGAVE